MYNIDDLGTVMEGKGLGTVGIDIFCLFAPPEKTNYALLYPSADPPVVDPELPGYYTGKFQIIVRHVDHAEGLDKCKAIAEAMTFNNLETTNLLIRRCRPLTQARIYRRSESGSLEFAVSYDIRFITK